MQQTVLCPSCGSQNMAGQLFCGACGARLVREELPHYEKEDDEAVSAGPVEVRPTWKLAWGLYWRMLLLSLFFLGIVYLIVVAVMYALGFTVFRTFSPSF